MCTTTTWWKLYAHLMSESEPDDDSLVIEPFHPRRDLIGNFLRDVLQANSWHQCHLPDRVSLQAFPVCEMLQTVQRQHWKMKQVKRRAYLSSFSWRIWKEYRERYWRNRSGAYLVKDRDVYTTGIPEKIIAHLLVATMRGRPKPISRISKK